MSKISKSAWTNARDKTEGTKFAETHWPVYGTDAYQLQGMEGFRYIRAAGTTGYLFSEAAKYIDPLSPAYADLFLKFARLFDTQEMDCEEEPGLGVYLDTPRNAEVALAWARQYGVLGLGKNTNESLSVSGPVGSSSAQIAAKRLGVFELGHEGIRAYAMSPRGGEHETVERFVFEAYEANVVLKLYEAATAPPSKSASDETKHRFVEGIYRFMSNKRNVALPKQYRFTEREVWGKNEESAQTWALGVVENAVHRKVEQDVYPILIGGSGSYEEGWGFKSLLGAMWLQMRAFMLGDTRYATCPKCRETFYKPRRNKEYCSEVCRRRARDNRSYERQKQHQQEELKETKRRLKR